MNSMDTLQIPLFPLGTVLFPDGILPLRIFEPRYLTMIGNCMRNGTGFGVVLISQGREAGIPAKFHKVGTVARIDDFDQLDDGHLGLSCHGEYRFKIISHAIQDDQLITAEVAPVAAEDHSEILPEHAAMSDFVRELYHKEALKAWAEGMQPQWQNGEWLGCRLCEILPLSMESRQALLEMQSSERLSQLSKIMKENQIILS